MKRKLLLWQKKIFSSIFLVLGIFLIFLALIVYIVQSKEIEVTAQVINKFCALEYNRSISLKEMRCRVDVKFQTKSGQTIETTVTDAFPSEITEISPNRSTIQLRYLQDEPYNPNKQTNYMTRNTFVGFIAGGITLMIVSLLFLKAEM